MASQEWVPLKMLKESNPIDVSKFVTDRNIADETPVAWWVPFVLMKRDRIIFSVNLRVQKATRKFGIKIPTSVAYCS